MGIDYSAYLHLGFIFKYDDLMKVIRTEVSPAKYRTENRYDSITGQITTPVQVLESCAQYRYQLGGEIIEIDEDADDYEELSLYTVLGGKLGAEVTRQFGEDNVFITVPSQELEWVGEIIDCGRVTFGSHLSYQSVVDAGPALERIRHKLIEYGFKPEEPLIIMNTSIG